MLVSLLLAALVGACLAAPVVIPLPGAGTLAVGPGTLSGGAIFGTITGALNPTGATLSAANPVSMTAYLVENGRTVTFSGVIPEFTAHPNASPGGEGFTGVGPLGTIGGGATQGTGGLGASVTGIGTASVLSGYGFEGTLHAGTNGVSGTLIATNTHSTINGGFVAAPTAVGGGVTAKRPGITLKP